MTLEKPRTPVRWQAQTVYGVHGLAEVAPEWDDLYRRCAAATPFLSYAWLSSWWDSYGRPGRLVLVLVRRSGRLVAGAALVRGRRSGIPVLTPVGAGVSDYTDVLVDDACAGQAAAYLARALTRAAGSRVVDLPEVPPFAAAWHMLDAWPARTWRLPASVCLEFDGRPIEDLIATMPADSARNRRRKLEKLRAVDLDVRLAGAERTAESVAALLRLHEEQWRGRGMNPEHARPRYAAHLARAADQLARQGEAAIVEYRRDGRLIGADLLLVGHRLVGAYLYGVHPDLRRGIDVTQLLLTHDLALTHRLGRPTLSLMRGDEPHKRRWYPRESRNERVLLAGRAELPATLYVARLRGVARLADTVRERPRLAAAARRVTAWFASCT